MPFRGDSSERELGPDKSVLISLREMLLTRSVRSILAGQECPAYIFNRSDFKQGGQSTHNFATITISLVDLVVHDKRPSPFNFGVRATPWRLRS